MRRLLFLLVAALLITACGTITDDVPPGKYVAYPDGHDVTPTVISAFGYTVELQAAPPTAQPQSTYTPYPTPTERPTYTPYPTYTKPPEDSTATPETIDDTPVPGTETPYCVLRVQGVRHLVRADHREDASIIGVIDIGRQVEGLSFYYTASEQEWVYATGPDVTNSNRLVTGWMWVDDNLLYDPQGPCIDVPAEYENELPTPVPTTQQTPVPTVEPGGECVVFNPYEFSTIRIRETYVVTGSNIIGALPVGARATVGHIYTKSASEQWVFITTGGDEPVYGWVATFLNSSPVGILEGDCSGVDTGPVRSVYPFGTGLKVSSQGSTLPGR